MISLIILILVAALVYYVCVSVGLPAVLAVIAVLLVFLVGIERFGLYGRRPPP